MNEATHHITLKNSIFKIGHVFSVEGREVRVKVDKRKNSSHLLYKGDLVKNISVSGYIKIVKGFISIIAKVEGEYIKEDKTPEKDYDKEENRIDRILITKLLGYVENEKFERGIKELPLIDNECFLLDRKEFEQIHQFVKSEDKALAIGTLALEQGQTIEVGVNSLFASHIGIFGNTGSGKSYTLAKIYRELFLEFEEYQNFKSNAKFLLFDFNGEYHEAECIINNKKVYNLNTKPENGEDKLPINENDLLDVSLLSILANATEKTQQPFLDRAIREFRRVFKKEEPLKYYQKILHNQLEETLCMSDKVKAYLILDYFKQILREKPDDDLTSDIDYMNKDNGGFFLKPINNNHYFSKDVSFVSHTKLYGAIAEYDFPDDFISKVVSFMYIQLIKDLRANRAQNDHIAPAINKLKRIQSDIEKVIDISGTNTDFWDDSYFAVINLNNVNLNMKKLLPLLISHKLYAEHKDEKKEETTKSLNIIIDEAHNILSYTSQRESETWKDYRLETFEEIIKEGRKFGVFLTIASQRPSDISPTIISQLHNYFIHRLINNKDLEMVEKTISFLDKVSTEALPILPTGVCVLSGLLAQIPIIVKIDEIEKPHEPHNKTVNLLKSWTDSQDELENTIEEPEEAIANVDFDDDLPF
jgi:DNA helicase HerA-like ATPase